MSDETTTTTEATSEEFKPLYFGEEKIVEMKDGVEPGTKRIVTEKAGRDVPTWEATTCISQEPKSLRDLQNERAIYVTSKILTLLREHDVRVDDIGPILQKVIDSCRMNEEKAIVKAFGFLPEDEKEVFEMKGEIRLADWDKMLKR